jgi:hypothetical protein
METFLSSFISSSRFQPIEIGAALIVLEKGNLQGSRGIVTQRNKGRGRVVLSIGGIEIKMDRHLLGK